MIDHDELGEIEDAYWGIRAALAPGPVSELGDVYVPGEGKSPIAFVLGEAPGADEHMKKRPFVGPSGIVLRDLMAKAELYAMPRGGTMPPNCWLTNVLKFRPPRNRNPEDNEITVCRSLIEREWIAVGKPAVIIAVGATALQCITGRKQSIMKVSGKVTSYYSKKSKMDIHVWPMVHPSFGLRPEGKAMRPVFERDWERLGEWLSERS